MVSDASLPSIGSGSDRVSLTVALLPEPVEGSPEEPSYALPQ